MVRLLLDAGADVNALAADDSGRTALQAAAKEGDIEMVDLLHNAGTDVNAPAASS
jgi:ankyrin repeat protein